MVPTGAVGLRRPRVHDHDVYTSRRRGSGARTRTCVWSPVTTCGGWSPVGRRLPSSPRPVHVGRVVAVVLHVLPGTPGAVVVDADLDDVAVGDGALVPDDTDDAEGVRDGLGGDGAAGAGARQLGARRTCAGGARPRGGRLQGCALELGQRLQRGGRDRDGGPLGCNRLRARGGRARQWPDGGHLGTDEAQAQPEHGQEGRRSTAGRPDIAVPLRCARRPRPGPNTPCPRSTPFATHTTQIPTGRTSSLPSRDGHGRRRGRLLPPVNACGRVSRGGEPCCPRRGPGLRVTPTVSPGWPLPPASTPGRTCHEPP